MAKLAVWPALTCLELEKDSIRTQSCGFLCALCGGADFVELGVGVGLGDVLDGSGVGDAGLDEPAVGDDEVLVAEGDCAFEEEAVDEGEALAGVLAEADLLMLAEPLGRADLLMLAEPLGEAALLMLAEPLGEAEPLPRAELLGDAEADADSLAFWLRGASVAAVSTAFFGIDEHSG